MKNIAFIINPMSGTQNKRRLPKLINELLDKRQWLENIVFTEREGHALTLAKQYATMGFDAVVAVGGDGLGFGHYSYGTDEHAGASPQFAAAL